MKKVKGRNGGTINVAEKGDNKVPNSGRKKKLPEIDDLLADVLGGDPDSDAAQSEAKEVLLSLLKQAKKGSVPAAIAVLNRAYGMPKQSVEHKGNKDSPVVVDFSGLSSAERADLLKLTEKVLGDK